MTVFGSDLDQFVAYLFFMAVAGSGFGLILGLFRFLLLTFVERKE